MHPLSVDKLSKAFVVGHEVVNNISFEIEPGEIVTVVGASGSGKTTLLRLLAGFEHPTGGTVSINDKLMSGGNQFVKPENRNVGFVFQDLALFPHLTVEQNVGFGVKTGKKETEQRVANLLSITGLQALGKRYPWQLSGGQQQRVAIARALAIQPAVLLMDEPFSSLDQALRVELREEILSILKQTGTTTLIVTHDIDDAYAMANRMMVMDNGMLAQFDTPEAIYSRPLNSRVARLGGKANILTRKQWQLEGLANEWLLVRPENIKFESVGGEWKITTDSFNGKYHEYLLFNGETNLCMHTTGKLPHAEAISIGIANEHYVNLSNG